MNRQIILTAILSGSLGFALAVTILPREPSASANSPAALPAESAINATTLARPTALLRRHERQSPEATTEAEAIIASIQRRKEARLEEIHKRSRGFLTLEDKQEIKAIEQEAELEIRNSVSHETYLTHRGKLFKTTIYGQQLNQSMALTEAELNAVMEFSMGMTEASKAPNRDELQAHHKAMLAEKLGQTRYQEYELRRSPYYLEVWSFTQRYGIDTAIADKIEQIRKEGEDAFFKIDKSLLSSRDGVREFSSQRQSAKDTVRARLTELIGADAADTYIRNSDRNPWMQ